MVTVVFVVVSWIESPRRLHLSAGFLSRLSNARLWIYWNEIGIGGGCGNGDGDGDGGGNVRSSEARPTLVGQTLGCSLGRLYTWWLSIMAQMACQLDQNNMHRRPLLTASHKLGPALPRRCQYFALCPYHSVDQDNDGANVSTSTHRRICKIEWWIVVEGS